MALTGCGRTRPSLKYIKKCPPTEEIAPFLHCSTKTLMACQNEMKKIWKILLLRLLSLVLVEMWKYRLFFKDHFVPNTKNGFSYLFFSTLNSCPFLIFFVPGPLFVRPSLRKTMIQNILMEFLDAMF